MRRPSGTTLVSKPPPVVVEGVDRENRRISLSLAGPARAAEDEEAPAQREGPHVGEDGDEGDDQDCDCAHP